MELLIHPTKAAYVRGGEHADKNGSEITADLELKTAAEDFTRRIFFTFDLSDLPSAFRRVFFRPVYRLISGADPMRYDLLRVSDDWNADTVTWNTQPKTGACLSRDGLVVDTVEVDLSEAVSSALAAGERLLSFAMIVNHPCTGSDRAVLIAAETALVVTDEPRAAHLPTFLEDDPHLTDEQRALLPYLPRNWQLKADRLCRERDGRFCLIVQTDTHSFNREDTFYGNNVKALAAFTSPDLAVNLGDIIRGYKYEEDNTDNLRACMDDMVRRYTESCPCPVLFAIGNHDHNGMWCRLNEVDDLITKQEHFDRVQKPLHAHNGAAMVTDRDNVCGDSLYSYIDFEGHNIRVILVDSTDDGKDFNSFKVSERQLWWLENVALKTEKHVLLMTHTPFFVEFPGAGNRVNGGDLVMEAVERFVAGGGKLIAYLYGHTHKQSAVWDVHGRRHMSFVNGGNNAEAVLIDIQGRTIETIGFGGSAGRKLDF